MKDPYFSTHFSSLTYFNLNRNPCGFLTEALLTSLAGVIQYLNTHNLRFITFYRWSVATSSNNHIYSLTRFKIIDREIHVVNPDNLEKLDHSEKSEERELEKENKTNKKKQNK